MSAKSYGIAWVILFAVFMSLTAACIAAETLPKGEVQKVLASGNVQTVLATCLISVAAALSIVSKLLYNAQRDRINALEGAQAGEIKKAEAFTELARAMDRLRDHCSTR